ncbi:MAG: hypothetical protein JNL69_02475, partial [Bacteroidia bacterium]|nr:hypothetical protein [Bacteroidia bacterium]
MKKHIFFLLLIVSSVVFAQEADDKAKWSVRESANNKSGNSQDVLTSFYQLAMKNLFGDSRTLEFQSSLFAIQAKADTSIWIDTAYLKRTFARNFVVGINMSVDSNFKFEKNTLQLKYAIINNRDKTVFDFAKTLGSLTQAINYAKRDALTKYIASGKNLTDEQNDYFNSDKNVNYETLPAEFRIILEEEFRKNPILKEVSPRDYMKIVHERYNIASNIIANKALWTIEAKF